MKFVIVSLDQEGRSLVVDESNAQIAAQLLTAALGGKPIHNCVYVVGVDDSAALTAHLTDTQVEVPSMADPIVQFSEVIGVPDGVVAFDQLVEMGRKRIAQLEARKAH